MVPHGSVESTPLPENFLSLMKHCPRSCSPTQHPHEACSVTGRLWATGQPHGRGLLKVPVKQPDLPKRTCARSPDSGEERLEAERPWSVALAQPAGRALLCWASPELQSWVSLSSNHHGFPSRALLLCPHWPLCTGQLPGPSQMHSRPPREAPYASVTWRGRANACRPHPLVASGAPTWSSLTWLLPAPQKVICPHCPSLPALGSTWVSHPQFVPYSAAVSMLMSKGHIADLFL